MARRNRGPGKARGPEETVVPSPGAGKLLAVISLCRLRVAVTHEAAVHRLPRFDGDCLAASVSCAHGDYFGRPAGCTPWTSKPDLCRRRSVRVGPAKGYAR